MPCFWFCGGGKAHRRPLLALQALELRPCAADHGLWDTGQLRHLQAITLAGGAVVNGMQEDDGVLVFGGGQVHVDGMVELVRQLRQFEVVGGKQGVTADFPGQVLCGGPGQGQAIKGAGAAADLVHKHQAVAAGIVEDVRGLGHFHHKGGAPASDVVGGAHTGENPVHRANHRPVRGHETAAIGEQGDQCRLSHVGGFTPHIGAGNHQHSPMPVHKHVIGHKRLIQQLFHHRVTAGVDVQARFVTEFRGGKAQAGGPLGEVAQHIQLRQGLGAVLQLGQGARQCFQQFVVEAFLPGQGPALCAQGLVLEFLEFRGDKAFGVFQGLAAYVVHRRLVRLGAADLDVVAMHPVVAHLQGADAGAIPFPGFHVQEELAGVLADVAQVIQRLVKAFADHSAVTDHHRRVVDNGALQQIGQIGILADQAGEPDHVMGADRLQGLLDIRQGGKGIPQAGQVPGAGGTQGDAGKNAFDIADPFEQIVHRFVMETIQQGRDRVLTLVDLLRIPQRPVEPAPQLARAHGGGGAIHDPGQGVLVAAEQVSVDFQVAATGGVQHHGVLAPLPGQFADMGQGGALGLPGILQQAPGRTDGQGQVIAAEAGQVPDLQLLGEQAVGRIGLEQPGSLATNAVEAIEHLPKGKVLADQHLRRAQSLDFFLQGVRALNFRDREPATGNIQGRQPEALPPVIDRHQQVVPAILQERLIAEGAGGYDTHYPTFHRALGGGRVTDLLADGDGLAGPHQAGDVVFGSVVGHTRHGDGIAAGLAPGGQGDVDQFSGSLGIVVEQLIEIPHPVEHQLVGVFPLDLQVLADHRGVVGKIALRCRHVVCPVGGVCGIPV